MFYFIDSQEKKSSASEWKNNKNNLKIKNLVQILASQSKKVKTFKYTWKNKCIHQKKCRKSTHKKW